MSTDKQVFPLYYEAKNDKVRKRLGIKGGFYWAEAKKLSIVISRGAVAIDDAGYDEDDFKKPVRVNLPVVDDLPPEGVFDTEFCNRYEKGGEDGITMVFIAPSSSAQDKPASTDNTNVNGEDMTEIEENMLLPISGQELPIRWLAQHGSEKPVTHVSRDELQALHIARAEELPAVTALAVSHKTSLLDPLEIRDLHKLVRDTDRVFPNPGNSSLGLMTAFFEAYLDADYTDRGLLTKEWMKGNRVSRITRTASGANAGSDPHRDCSDETGEASASSLEKLDWKRQVVIAAVYGLCANPAGIASAPLIPGIAMMIANKLENFGVTDDEHIPDF
ncbi:hypothetical protein JV476_003263 [Escherichia coli]|nr:hypothetical protein [Escherichia coli]